MLRLLPCIIAAAFITGSLAISLSPGARHNIALLEATLQPPQLATYHAIRDERATIYLWSLALGFAVGLAYLALADPSSKSADRCWSHTCGFVAIVLIVNHIAYMLWPKSQYMVQILDTEEQRTAWLRVYRGMQVRQYGGLLLGAVGLGVFGKFSGC